MRALAWTRRVRLREIYVRAGYLIFGCEISEGNVTQPRALLRRINRQFALFYCGMVSDMCGWRAAGAVSDPF